MPHTVLPPRASDSTAPPVWNADALRDPHGAPDKAARVRRMFDEIARTYERVNSLTSLGRDAHWRREAVRLAKAGPTDRVLDVACGTGDLARAFWAAGVGRVVGIDFAEDMLRLATHRTIPPAARPAPKWSLADAQRLPFADASFEVASCAFGVRNFQDLAAGLREMARVLSPGGRAIILEFSLPRNRAMRAAYRLYLQYVLPLAARLVSGERVGAYRYLARSVLSFVDEAGVVDALKKAGFSGVARHRLTFGIVHVYVAQKCTMETSP